MSTFTLIFLFPSSNVAFIAIVSDHLILNLVRNMRTESGNPFYGVEDLLMF